MKTRISRSKIVVLSIFSVIVGIWGISAQGRDNPEQSDSRIQQGFEIAPVPLNLEGKNRALVPNNYFRQTTEADIAHVYAVSGNKERSGENTEWVD